MASRKNITTLMLGLSLMAGCPSDGPGGGGGSGSSSGGADGPGTTQGTDSTGVDTTADTTGDTTGGGVDETTGPPPLPPLPCPEEFDCKADWDLDGKPFYCDNAPDHTNPDQGDMDYDSFGDVVDRCPTVQGLSNTIDSDRDGVGNDCDLCPRPAGFYQGMSELPARYEVRNVPLTGDMDRDGVGDACDNCPTVPNCLGFGDGPGLTPYVLGTPIDHEDPECQVDTDFDGIGDACEGEAGVGFGDGDDFDADGLTNAVDLCPRLPTTLGACSGAGDCPSGSSCIEGMCNHLDPDGDGVGTECDTCPFAPNPGQVTGGQQTDDPDGDFIGNECETHPGCQMRDDPRPLRFYDVSVGGYCCATVYEGQALQDPDGVELEPGSLPVNEPGTLLLPPGCLEALAEAGVDEATRLGPGDVGGVGQLWQYVCLMPPWDQDFDGIGDECDLCEFAYDPANTPFVDSNGMEWPNDGAYCNGDYVCIDE